MKTSIESRLTNPQLQIELVASELQTPTLLQVTSFLYDFNLVYEVSRLATDRSYERSHISRYVYYRYGRPLRDEDRLSVVRLREESPLELVTTVAVAGGAVIGAIWGIVQIAERISNWRLNRDKLRQEVERLRRENEEAKQPLRIVDEEEAIVRLSRTDAVPILDQLGERLAGSPLRIQQLEITIKTRSRTTKGEKK